MNLYSSSKAQNTWTTHALTTPNLLTPTVTPRTCTLLHVATMHQQIDASRQGAFPCAAALGVFPPAAGFARRAADGDRRFQLPQLLAWLGLGLGLGLGLNG